MQMLWSQITFEPGSLLSQSECHASLRRGRSGAIWQLTNQLAARPMLYDIPSIGYCQRDP